MGRLMLDIGAGGSSFARLFRKYNPHLNATVFCGEPGWTWTQGIGFWGSVKKIDACYNAFNLPDESLDIVSLNAFHPYCAPRDIESEVLRCLKKGGLFFSAHPVGLMPSVSLEGKKNRLLTELLLKGTATGIWKSSFTFEKRQGSMRGYESTLMLGGEWETIRYPASPTIADRLNVLRYPHAFSEDQLNSYIYRYIQGEPTLRVWVRE
jgi:hypothetical protein